MERFITGVVLVLLGYIIINLNGNLKVGEITSQDGISALFFGSGLALLIQYFILQIRRLL